MCFISYSIFNLIDTAIGHIFAFCLVVPTFDLDYKVTVFVNEIAKLILHYLRTTFAKDLITREAIIQINTLSPNLTVSLLFIGSLY